MEFEFVKCVKEAELENNLALAVTGTRPKKKSEETKQDLSTLEKQLLELNGKKRKLS